jgi:hypothetical protein
MLLLVAGTRLHESHQPESMAAAASRHVPTEQLVDQVLNSAHERLRQRCDRTKIVVVLEEKHGAYDVHAVHSLLTRKYDVVDEQLESAGAAPSAFLAILWPLVQLQVAESAAAETKQSAGSMASRGSLFGKAKGYEKLARSCDDDDVEMVGAGTGRRDERCSEKGGELRRLRDENDNDDDDDDDDDGEEAEGGRRLCRMILGAFCVFFVIFVAGCVKIASNRGQMAPMAAVPAVRMASPVMQMRQTG